MSQRCVIFDMDGVLVASGNAHHASWRQLARKHGIEVDAATFAGTFGMTSREIIRTLWARELTDDDVRRIDEEKEAVYRALITGMVPLAIGARECLHALQQAGLVLAVGTSGPVENLDLVLDETQLRSFFSATVTAEDVAHGKPAPDVFLKAAERVGIAPTACVVIEDAPVGIMAARAAEMVAVGYTGTHEAAALREAGAGMIVAGMSEITPGLISDLLT